MPALSAAMWKGANGNLMKNGDLCAFARDVPKVKPAGADQKENNRRERARTCVQNIVNHLIQYPDTAESVWSSIEAGLACASTKECAALVEEDSPSKPWP